jgi:hypothetical protein
MFFYNSVILLFSFTMSGSAIDKVMYERSSRMLAYEPMAILG